MGESIEKFEAGVDEGTESGMNEMNKDWVGYSLEKDIVNPKEGNEKVYEKLTELHKGMSEDSEVGAATADAQAKLDELKSSLA